MSRIVQFPNLLSPSLCQEIIAAAEKSSLWHPAQVYAASGKPKADTKHRNNDILDELPGGRLYAELHLAVEKGLEFYKRKIGLDKLAGHLQREEFQLNRYAPGGFYNEHVDSYHSTLNRQVSVVAYLNSSPDGPCGGGTYFPLEGKNLRPLEGSIAYFPSNFCYPHGANPPLGWTKYSVVTWYSLK